MPACESCDQGSGNPATTPEGEYREEVDMYLCDVCFEEASTLAQYEPRAGLET